MEKENNKRVRSANYSRDEIAHLLNLVAKYKNVIENKTTDGVTWRKKESTWKQITVEFNANSPSGIYRQMESLKKCYDNKKKEVRKSAANERRALCKTGGGPPENHMDSLKEITLSLMNRKTVYGLENSYDCDKLSTPRSINIQENQEYNNSIQQGGNTLESDEYNLDDDDRNGGHLSGEEETNENCQEATSSSAQQTRTSLPVCVKRKVHGKSTKVDDSTTWTSRRRPVVTALSSSHISKEYTTLAKSKEELVRLQIELLKQEKEYKQIEHELKVEKLKLEIEITKKQRHLLL